MKGHREILINAKEVKYFGDHEKNKISRLRLQGKLLENFVKTGKVLFCGFDSTLTLISERSVGAAAIFMLNFQGG